MRRASVLFALMLAAGALLPQSAAAQEWRASQGTLANLRSGPGTNFAIVGRIEEGRTYYQVGRQGRWIELGDGSWVNDGFVERVAPFTPARIADVRLEPPETLYDTADGTILALTPSAARALVRLSGSAADAQFHVLDMADRSIGLPLSYIPDPDRFQAPDYQFIGEHYLSIADDQRQVLIDLMGEQSIYDGAPIVFSVIGVPEDAGFDRIVSLLDNLVIFTDPDTFEIVDSELSVADRLGLAEFSGFHQQHARYARFAGLGARDEPLVLFTGLRADGMSQAVRLADLQGTPQGPLVTLAPRELVFAAFPALDGFLTVEAVGMGGGPVLSPGTAPSMLGVMGQTSITLLANGDQRDPNFSFGSAYSGGFDIRLRFRDIRTGEVLRSFGGSGQIGHVQRGGGDDHVLVHQTGLQAGRLSRFDLDSFTVGATSLLPDDWLMLSRARSQVEAVAMVRTPPPDIVEEAVGNFVGVTRDNAIQLSFMADDRLPERPANWGRALPGRLAYFELDLETLSGRYGEYLGVRPAIQPPGTQIGQYRFANPYSFFLPADGSVTRAESWAPTLGRATDLSFRDERRVGADDAGIPTSIGRPRRDHGVHPRLAVTLGTDMSDTARDMRAGVIDLASGQITHLADVEGTFGDARNGSPNFIPDLQAVGGLSQDGTLLSHFYVGRFFMSDDGQRLHVLRLGNCGTSACDVARPVAWLEQEQPVMVELVTFDPKTGSQVRSIPLPYSAECRARPRIVPGMSADDLFFQHCAILQRINAVTGTMREQPLPQPVLDVVMPRYEWQSPSWRLVLDGSLLVMDAPGNATLRFVSVATGRQVAEFFLYPDASWVLLTDAGFYAAGGGGDRNLVIRQGQSAFPINRFRTALFRPDLVYEALRGDPEGLVQDALSARSLDSVLASGEAPDVTLRVTAQRGQAEAAVQLRDTGGGVGAVEWRVNGVVRHRSRGAAPQTVTIDLAEGRNLIEVVARNANDLIESRSDLFEVNVAPEDSAPPRLFVLAAGVNDYQQDVLDLSYAVSDARRIGAAFEAAGAGLYDEIFTTVLIDAEVTRANLDREFARLSQSVRPNDVFVFFLAGHGKTIDGRYYFVPPDFSGSTLGELRETGLGQSLFADWFSNIPAQRSLLLFDTCDSGSLVETEVGRTLGNAVSNELLGSAVGRAILSASSSQGVALEGYQGSGLFTHVVIDSLGTADRDADGFIDVLELADEVAGRLPSLALSAFGEDQQSAFRPPFVPFQVVRAVTPR